jgi:rubredoxin
MGVRVKARCNNCNFEFRFKNGTTKGEPSVYLVPALNILTLEFENVNNINLKDRWKYSFYDNDNLNSENNYCPNCKKNELQFRTTVFY